MQATKLRSGDAHSPSRVLVDRHSHDHAIVHDHSVHDHTIEVDSSWLLSDLAHALLTATPLLVADVLAVVGSFALGWNLAAAIWPLSNLDGSLLVTAFTSAICLANLAVGLYPGIGLSAISEVRQGSKATALVGLLFLIVSAAESQSALPVQFAIVVTCCLLIGVLPLSRGVARSLFSRFRWWGQPALIVGGAPAVAIYSFLRRNPRLGLRPLGIVGEWQAKDDRAASPHHLGPLSRASAMLKELGTGWLIVAMPERPVEEVQSLVKTLERQVPHRTVISDLDGSPSLWNRASACIDWPGKRDRPGSTPLSRFLKRTIDVALTTAGGTLLLPLMFVIAALIKLESSGPVLFRQERVGRHGRRFRVWKFRTMICNGDRVLKEYLAACPERLEQWNRDHKLPHDPRVTRVGWLLRKTSLDELPQLWNVLRGDMSLVGPRPILASEIVDFGASFEAFCSVLPGITGLWQVSGRNQTTYAEHIELDSYYARHWSLWLDLYILVLTVKVVLFRQGAY